MAVAVVGVFNKRLSVCLFLCMISQKSDAARITKLDTETHLFLGHKVNVTSPKQKHCQRECEPL